MLESAAYSGITNLLASEAQFADAQKSFASTVDAAMKNAPAGSESAVAAFNGLKRAGKIPADKRVKFVAFGGDGGTYDIGLQSLSGAMERGHRMAYSRQGHDSSQSARQERGQVLVLILP